MNFFDEATLRLKQELRMAHDQEVAAALGMTARAWVGRKKRGSFPETELLALKGRRPDLPLDVGYVLTGERFSATGAAELQKIAQYFSGSEGDPNSASHAMGAAQSIAEAERARRPLYDRIGVQLEWFSSEELELIEKLFAVCLSNRRSTRAARNAAMHNHSGATQTFHGKVGAAIHGDHATVHPVKQTKPRGKA